MQHKEVLTILIEYNDECSLVLTLMTGIMGATTGSGNMLPEALLDLEASLSVLSYRPEYLLNHKFTQHKASTCMMIWYP